VVAVEQPGGSSHARHAVLRDALHGAVLVLARLVERRGAVHLVERPVGDGVQRHHVGGVIAAGDALAVLAHRRVLGAHVVAGPAFLRIGADVELAAIAGVVVTIAPADGTGERAGTVHAGGNLVVGGAGAGLAARAAILRIALQLGLAAIGQ